MSNIDYSSLVSLYIAPAIFAIEIPFICVYFISSMAFIKAAIAPWLDKETLKKGFENPGIWIALNNGGRVSTLLLSHSLEPSRRSG